MYHNLHDKKPGTLLMYFPPPLFSVSVRLVWLFSLYCGCGFLCFNSFLVSFLKKQGVSTYMSRHVGSGGFFYCDVLLFCDSFSLIVIMSPLLFLVFRRRPVVALGVVATVSAINCFAAEQHNNASVPLHQMTASAVGNTPERDIDKLKEVLMRGVMHADERLFSFKVSSK